MKRITVTEMEPIKPVKTGEVITIQRAGEILILDFWKNRSLIGRYCMDQNGNYKTYITNIEKKSEQPKWCKIKLSVMISGESPYWMSLYSALDKVVVSSKDAQLAKEFLGGIKTGYRKYEKLRDIDDIESNYNQEKRIQYETSRLLRLNQFMDALPAIPDDFDSWIFETAGAGAEYMFFDKQAEDWICTACSSRSADSGIKIRHNDVVTCPACGKTVQAKKRVRSVNKETHCLLIQNIDTEKSVNRHFDIDLEWSGTGKRITKSESERMVLYRQHPRGKTRELFYNQYDRRSSRALFDRNNPANRRTFPVYLYPGGIEEGLRGTEFQRWGRLLKQMSETSEKVHYAKLMTMREPWVERTVEYLYKGHFRKLLEDTLENMYWWGGYVGPLNLRGDTIEEVFKIHDRQIINRIRDCDGGENTIAWMQWCGLTGKKLKQATLEWLVKEKIKRSDIQFILDRMMPEQVMNYVIRQQGSSYKNEKTHAVISQWEDYLDMASQQMKDTSDEMVYRPRELKRRHDEMVEEIRKKEMAEAMKKDKKRRAEAEKRMREKFPGAEEILKEIRIKYEYQNEEYIMIVPKRLGEIIEDGNALHHCAGATDRYFDRILSRETYICFLRRRNEPKMPYYTIEFEPSGTIRQHRGYLDEEPEIERIRPFLKEWQAEVKKRLSSKDKDLARISAVKRKENIEDLKKKNNIRVLNALLEDFMESAI